MLVKAIRASAKDPQYSFTYRTKQFKDLVFAPNDRYIFEYRSGNKIELKASRDGTTLYTGVAPTHSLPLPEIGKPVMHDVVNVYKQLKSVK